VNQQYSRNSTNPGGPSEMWLALRFAHCGGYRRACNRSAEESKIPPHAREHVGSGSPLEFHATKVGLERH